MDNGALLLMIIGILSFVVIAISIRFCFANRMQEIADMKKAPFSVWSWCFLLPFFGIPMVIALPDRGNTESLPNNGAANTEKSKMSSNYDLLTIANNHPVITEEGKWLCPDCRSSNSKKMTQCAYCGYQATIDKKTGKYI